MSQHNEYLVEDVYNSYSNIKVLKIIGHLEFNENEIVKKIHTAIREVLNKNQDVDYLIVYYFPTQNDKEKNAALCFLDLIDEDVKNFHVSTPLSLSKRIRWNEDYGFFSDGGNEKTSFDYRLVKDTYALLQMTEDAFFLLYELRIIADKKNPFSNELYQRLENWIFKAKHINKGYGDLEPIVQNDFMGLARHLSNILYCCLSEIGKNTSKEKDRQWILRYELANAQDKYEVIHHQLLYIMRKYLIREDL